MHLVVRDSPDQYQALKSDTDIERCSSSLGWGGIVSFLAKCAERLKAYSNLASSFRLVPTSPWVSPSCL